MHFEENQLSPRSIGISPLPTAPPSILQHTPVRSSTRHYPRFNLAMGRSRGFGSTARYQGPELSPVHALFRLAFAQPSGVGSLKQRQRTVTRRLILQKARRQAAHKEHGPPTACRRRGFRDSFTPLPGCFSPFPHGTRSLSVAQSI